jgi:hypothetical protein
MKNAVQASGLAMQHAEGEFEVRVTPLPLDGPAEDPTLGRLALDKRFHGDLDAVGGGQMLTSTASQDSRGYVAIERVTGTLHGRRGSFTFQHWGTMAPGERHIEVEVVPGSGTDELAGLAGTFTIAIADGRHSYDFAYSLPAAPSA